jgi:hypothetical protein
MAVLTVRERQAQDAAILKVIPAVARNASQKVLAAEQTRGVKARVQEGLVAVEAMIDGAVIAGRCKKSQKPKERNRELITNQAKDRRAIEARYCECWSRGHAPTPEVFMQECSGTVRGHVD